MHGEMGQCVWQQIKENTSNRRNRESQDERIFIATSGPPTHSPLEELGVRA